MQQVTLSLEADLAAKLQQLTQLFGSEDLLFRNFLDFTGTKSVEPFVRSRLI